MADLSVFTPETQRLFAEFARRIDAHAPKHLHFCADHCGDYYVCSRRDGCDRDWTCPACEQERLDHYMTLAAEKETN